MKLMNLGTYDLKEFLEHFPELETHPETKKVFFGLLILSAYIPVKITINRALVNANSGRTLYTFIGTVQGIQMYKVEQAMPLTDEEQTPNTLMEIFNFRNLYRYMFNKTYWASYIFGIATKEDFKDFGIDLNKLLLSTIKIETWNDGTPKGFNFSYLSSVRGRALDCHIPINERNTYRQIIDSSLFYPFYSKGMSSRYFLASEETVLTTVMEMELLNEDMFGFPELYHDKSREISIYELEILKDPAYKSSESALLE